MNIDDTTYKEIIKLLEGLSYYKDKDFGPEDVEVAEWVEFAHEIRGKIHE